MWRPIIEKFKSTLALWHGRVLSFAGRITLINSVMTSLPIFFFSFYKVPVCIRKELYRIRQSFLWGGSEPNKKIHWVKWESVCKEKENGGLGIKSLSEINLALISKWKWRIMTEDDSLWSRVLSARYGNLKLHILKGEFGVRKLAYAWWKDLVNSRTVMANLGFCFASCIRFEVGDDRSVPFWIAIWCGDIPLAALFSYLYCICKTKSYCVNQMGSWSNGSWIWRDFGIEPDEIGGIWNRLQSLKVMLAGYSPTVGEKATVRWMSHEADIYTVSEAYRLMTNPTDQDWLLDDQRKEFRRL